MSETVGETLGEFRHELGEPRGSLGRVRDPSGRSGTGRGTLKEVRDRSVDP